MKKNISFWYVVPVLCVPFFYFFIRFLLPDLSFDSVNYHVFLGESGLYNFFFPFGNREFFPNGYHSTSPFFETINALFREIFGYRLGTLPSLFSYFIIIIYVYKLITFLLPDFFVKTKSIFKVFMFFNIFIIFELLTQMATYYIDITSTAFLICGFYYFMKFIKQDQRKDLFISSFVFGLLFFGKLTNAVFLIPFLCIMAYVLVKKKSWKNLFISLVLCFIPMGIFSLKLWLMTGNPVFPFYNSLFKSPYFLHTSYHNNDFGPRNIIEGLLWPFVSIFEKSRLGELERFFYDMKLSVYFFITFIFGTTLLFNKKNEYGKKIMVLFFFISYYIWVFTFGYLRYATFLEVLGGILFILFWDTVRKSHTSLRVMGIAFLIFLSLQNYRILKVNLTNENAWRIPFYKNISYHFSQIPYLFDKKMNFSPEIEKKINTIDIYVNCAMPGSGYFVLFKEKKPLFLSSKLSDAYGFSFVGKSEFLKRLSLTDKNRKYLTFAVFARKDGYNPNFKNCIDTLAKEGAHIDNQFEINTLIGQPIQGVLLFGQYPIIPTIMRK